MKTLYLIGGPMGVGKTTAGRLLRDRLPHSVFLDGDWCWDMMVLAVLLSALCVLAGEYLFNERNIQRLEADREQIRLSDERFRIALENGRLSIWDYDFATHSIIQPEHALMLHGSDRVILNVPQSLVAGGIVHPDSVHDFLEMYEHLRAGASPVEGVFRIRRSEQGYWYQHIRYTTLTDKHGRPYRAIGMDVVACSVPGTHDSRHLFGEKEFAAMARKTFSRLRPASVSRYSTRTGTSAKAVRQIRPSASISFSVSASTLALTAGMPFFSSPKRRTSCRYSSR